MTAQERVAAIEERLAKDELYGTGERMSDDQARRDIRTLINEVKEYEGQAEQIHELWPGVKEYVAQLEAEVKELRERNKELERRVEDEETAHREDCEVRIKQMEEALRGWLDAEDASYSVKRRARDKAHQALTQETEVDKPS